MKDSKGYIRARKRVDPATAQVGRTFGLCGAPDPATAEDDAGDLPALVRVLRYEIAPALWEIARAVRIAEALDAPPFSPCAAPRRPRKGKAARP